MAEGVPVTKRCTDCGEMKPLDEFHNSVSQQDGRQSKCKPCKLADNAKWRKANKGKVAQSKRNYALYNAEKIRLQAQERRKDERFRAHMGEYRRKWSLAKRYGITIEDHERLYAACGGKCQICQHELNFDRGSKHMACVDHDHETGRVRGILCRKCNQALGTFGDGVEGLQKAIDYLKAGTTNDGNG